MTTTFDKRNHTYKFAFLFLFAILVFSGCTTDFFGGGTAPVTEEKAETKAPPAPVIVDGIRTSYADLVEKATPAVVQITSTLKTSKKQKTSASPFEEFFKQLPQPLRD